MSPHHHSSLSTWLRNLCAGPPQAPTAAPPTTVDCSSPNWEPECFLWFYFVITTKLIHFCIIQILYTNNPYIEYFCKFKWKIVTTNCSFSPPLYIQLDRSARFGVQCVQCITLFYNMETLLGCRHNIYFDENNRNPLKHINKVKEFIKMSQRHFRHLRCLASRDGEAKRILSPCLLGPGSVSVVCLCPVAQFCSMTCLLYFMIAFHCLCFVTYWPTNI